MHYYRQHPIALLSSLLAFLGIVALGTALTLLLGSTLPLMLALPLALLLGLWRLIRWATFVVLIEGRYVRMRSLKGFAINERILPVFAPGGLRLHQNMLGWMLDYGVLRIEVFGGPVLVAYIAPFSALKRQIEAA